MVYITTQEILLVLVVLQWSIENAEPLRAAKCGVIHIYETKLIVRGNETYPGEWPWHAAIYRWTGDSEAYSCGGTLVSERIILTAAHCTFGNDLHQLSNDNISVRLGVYNLHKLDHISVQNISVQQIYLHPNYTSADVQNDIAVLVLSTMAKFGKFVQPACLGLPQDLTGRNGTAVGWGSTENEEVSPILKSSRMPVVDFYTCLTSDRPAFGETLSETILCAGYTNGTGVCNGDSGSGLFFPKDNAWYLGGIVSYMGQRSFNDQRCYGYAAFTYVQKYLPWITDISNDSIKTSTFIDCRRYLTCTQCVSSQFPCDWCIEAHLCTHDAAKNCHKNTLVSGISRIGSSFRSGPGFCPTINAPGEGQEIMVASGTKKQVKVKVLIVGQFMVQMRFVCQFNIEGRVTSVNAQHLGDMIYCDEMEFAYGAMTPNLTATFAVIWSGSKPLDNPNNIRVVIYRCKEMSNSCNVCLTLDRKYRCGWCSSTNACEVEHQCGISGKIEDQENNNWLISHLQCPRPEIHWFKPDTGPWEGGTNITIRGKHLGTKFEDVDEIKIAGIGCIPSYVQTTMIVCKLEEPGVKAHRSGPVVVQIAGFRGESTYDFDFLYPDITGFRPKLGPIAGGTILKIQGKNLDIGSKVNAFIGHYRCNILSTDENEITCRTTAVQSPALETLRVEFDNGVRELKGDSFEYVSNPLIDYVTYGDPGRMETARGIPVGGIKNYVVGQNFFSIEKPKIYVYYRDHIFLNECKSISNKEMQCLSPEIDLQEVDTFQSDEPLQLEYGFFMDDVKSVHNLSSKLGSWFKLYPDPVYYPFKENLQYSNGEYLTINGRNLDQALKESDVTVKIGDNAICNITSLSRQQLICQPPMDQKIKNINVKVIVGNRLTYSIGQISYFSNSLVLSISSQLAILGVICFVGWIIYCMKRSAKKYRTEQSNLEVQYRTTENMDTHDEMEPNM